MINNVCIEGFVGKKFQEGVIKTYPVLYFRLVHYGTGNNKNYQVINCQLIGTKVETFKKNINKYVNKKVIVVGALRSGPDGINFVQTSYIALTMGTSKATLVPNEETIEFIQLESEEAPF